jgi:hypothetical protein
MIDFLNFLFCVDLFMEDQMSEGNTCQDIRNVNLHKAATTESHM